MLGGGDKRKYVSRSPTEPLHLSVPVSTTSWTGARDLTGAWPRVARLSCPLLAGEGGWDAATSCTVVLSGELLASRVRFGLPVELAGEVTAGESLVGVFDLDRWSRWEAGS